MLKSSVLREKNAHSVIATRRDKSRMGCKDKEG